MSVKMSVIVNIYGRVKMLVNTKVSDINKVAGHEMDNVSLLSNAEDMNVPVK